MFGPRQGGEIAGNPQRIPSRMRACRSVPEAARLALTQSGVASSVRGLIMQSFSFAARSVACASYQSTDLTSSWAVRVLHPASIAIMSPLTPTETIVVFFLICKFFEGRLSVMKQIGTHRSVRVHTT